MEASSLRGALVLSVYSSVFSWYLVAKKADLSATQIYFFQPNYLRNDLCTFIRKLVKTILHARDPLFGGQGKEETMGITS